MAIAFIKALDIIGLIIHFKNKKSFSTPKKFQIKIEGSFYYKYFYVNRFPSMTLTVEIISGQHIPKPKGATEGEVVDPYIEVILERLK